MLANKKKLSTTEEKSDSKIKPTISEIHIARCCDKSFTGGYKGEVLSQLLDHIQQNHPSLYKKIEEEGRRNARGQNGAGYWDGPSLVGFVDGWGKAQPSFRRAHMQEALKYMLQDGKI